MTLVACDQLADFGRAAEWCRVVVDLARRRNRTPLAVPCRTIYAGVLTTLGERALAEEQLVASPQTYERLGGATRIPALSRLAELRIRQGRLEDAEHLLEGHTERPGARPDGGAPSRARRARARGCSRR